MLKRLFLFHAVFTCTSFADKPDGNHGNRRLVLDGQEVDLTQEVLNMKAEINSLKAEIAHLKSNPAGSSYTRWGRTSCPGNGTSLAYTGYMAGANHYSPGGASNYVCIADQPLWEYYDETIASTGGIYGVEYEFWYHRADGASKFFGTNIYNQNAPCSVCRSTRSTSIMVPGRNECYDGWTKEYSGYLVCGHTVETHASEYVCLDRRPEAVVGSGSDDNENYLFLVEAKCGKSLECPPYIDGRELTCVVCSM